jgi:uncharacterized protein YecT (DUF1311 family)
MLNIVAFWGVGIMPGLMRQMGRGLALSCLVGAIAACQPAAETPEQTTETPDTPTTEQPTTQPETVTEAPTPDPSPAPTEPTPSAPANVQAQPKPVPPLPPECNNPQTQMAMNQCAQAEYEQADVQLNNAYQALKGSLGPQKTDQLVAAEQAWLDFRDAYCDFVQSQFAGGSIQPTVYYGCLTQLTRDRTDELQQTKGATVSYQAADQELNAVYQQLQGLLSPAEQEMLTDAQLAWIDYRDLHCAFEGGDTDACLAQVTETRVSQLREQLDSRSL